MLLLLKSSSSFRQQRGLLTEEETGAYNMDKGLENMLNSGGGNTGRNVHSSLRSQQTVVRNQFKKNEILSFATT